MVPILFILLNIIILFFLSRLLRPLFSPAVVFSAIWTFTLLLHYICSFTVLPDIFPISTSTYLLFTVGVLSFGLGSFFASLNHSARSSKGLARATSVGSPAPTPITVKLRLIILMVTLAILPFYVKTAIDIVVASEVENFLMGLRWQLSMGEADYGWYKYIISLSIISFAFNLIENLRNPCLVNRILVWLSFLATLGYIVLFTGRTFFLLIFLLFIFCNLVLNQKFRAKMLLLILPLILLAFIAYGLMLNKGGSFEDSFSDNLKSSSELTAVYMVASLSAFEYEVENELALESNGVYSLRFFYLIAEKLGFTITPKFKENLVQDFVFIPYETNVYTYYSPYVRDFGYVYALICLFVFGLIHTYVFLQARTQKKPAMVIYFSLLMYPLCMSIFSDNYLTLLSSWIQFVLYIEGIGLINRLFIKKVSPASPASN